MNGPLHDLARAAGVVPAWQDYRYQWHDVAPDTLRTVLAHLGLPAASDAQIVGSRAVLADRGHHLAPLITAEQGKPIPIGPTGTWMLVLETGEQFDGHTETGFLPPIGTPGYHRLEIAGQQTTIAVAPPRGFTIQDASSNLDPSPGSRPYALAVQLYALRRANDGGIGDFRALQEFVAPAARHGAAGLAISPVHAQFSADIHRFSPYSPSSRIQLNVLHAGIDLPDTAECRRLSNGSLVDWPAAARLRLDALRSAFEHASPALLQQFAEFRAAEGDALENHARFEALHAHQFAAGRWHWRDWPIELQSPESLAVHRFAVGDKHEVDLHAFMQFTADRSLGAVQAAALAAGMPIGLIADLAVGADSGGSQCWARQAEILGGMSVGAPPDLLSASGQTWGLAAFSPTGLKQNGYRAFIEMLRHAMRHAGGVRIDHALGLARLWVVPDGASAREGAYLTYPLEDLLRLIALESHRNRAIVLGEDLGTIPEGFQQRLAEAGTLGMRVLWFERYGPLFTDPRSWTPAAAAMTSTHDLATVAGWWAGRDLQWRGSLGISGGSENHAREEQERIEDRTTLWSAMEFSGAASGPAPDPDDAETIADAATRHIATAACDLVILPIEDALALVEQPNLPGTMDEQHPNWRRRLEGPAATLLDSPRVAARLTTLSKAHPFA